jgi:uncharacterized protein YbjT (DUF2867 family)
VLVTGATGLLGRSLLGRSAASSYRVRALSRSGRAQAGTASSSVEWLQGDLVAGSGLDAATDGADVLIHAASSPRKETERTDVDGTKRLLDAARRAGVGHVIYISIVGVDRVPAAYYRLKLEAERVVEGSGVPWTILRATQFHDFIDFLFGAATRFRIGVLPKSWLVQSIDVDEVADALWDCAASRPQGRAPDIAGPQVLRCGDMMRTWLVARGMRKLILNIPIGGTAAASVRKGGLTAPDRAVGRVTWDAWLRSKYRGVRSGAGVTEWV